MRKTLLVLLLPLALWARPARADLADIIVQIDYDATFDDAIRLGIDVTGATNAMACPQAYAVLSIWVGWEMPVATATLNGVRTLGPVPGLTIPRVTTISCQYAWRPNTAVPIAGQWWRATVNPICSSGVLAGQSIYDLWQFGSARFWSHRNGPWRAKQWWADKLQSCGFSVDVYYNAAWEHFCLDRVNPDTGQHFQKCTDWTMPGGL